MQHNFSCIWNNNPFSPFRLRVRSFISNYSVMNVYETSGCFWIRGIWIPGEWREIYGRDDAVVVKLVNDTYVNFIWFVLWTNLLNHQLSGLKNFINCERKININREAELRRRYNWIVVTYFPFWYLMNSTYLPNHS